MSVPVTPAQTVGPFFAIGLPWPDGPFVVPNGTADAFWVRGRVLDGAGQPVPDALVETWQADREGRFRGASWRGLGRCPTDDEGRWGVLAPMPGAIDDQAPHVAVSVFGRGLLRHLVTRIYFPDHVARHGEDPVLAALEPDRRATLIATRETDGYRFDIHLQGPDETVFFAV